MQQVTSKATANSKKLFKQMKTVENLQMLTILSDSNQ